jgi:hypothetical protein
MAHKAWRVILQDGSYTMVRVHGKSVSREECLEILEYRGYTGDDIQRLEEVEE